MQLEGNSLQTLIARSEDLCNKYSATFEVPISGRYRLKVSWLRRDYEAIRPIPIFPLMDISVLVDDEVPRHLDVHMPRMCSYEPINGYWVSRVDHLSNEPMVMNKDCAGLLGEIKSYVRASLHSPLTKLLRITIYICIFPFSFFFIPYI